ncbi:Hypothetical protein CINCED_3A009246, partial [Cinara cedri]
VVNYGDIITEEYFENDEIDENIKDPKKRENALPNSTEFKQDIIDQNIYI